MAEGGITAGVTAYHVDALGQTKAQGHIIPDGLGGYHLSRCNSHVGLPLLIFWENASYRK